MTAPQAKHLGRTVVMADRPGGGSTEREAVLAEGQQGRPRDLRASDSAASWVSRPGRWLLLCAATCKWHMSTPAHAAVVGGGGLSEITTPTPPPWQHMPDVWRLALDAHVISDGNSPDQARTCSNPCTQTHGDTQGNVSLARTPPFIKTDEERHCNSNRDSMGAPGRRPGI